MLSVFGVACVIESVTPLMYLIYLRHPWSIWTLDWSQYHHWWIWARRKVHSILHTLEPACLLGGPTPHSPRNEGWGLRSQSRNRNPPPGWNLWSAPSSRTPMEQRPPRLSQHYCSNRQDSLVWLFLLYHHGPNEYKLSQKRGGGE